MDASLKIRLPVDLKARAEKVAERSLISLSDVARQAIKAAVETDEAKSNQPQPEGAADKAAIAQ
ncbi:hypothetical protein [Prosthecobacter sp.]|uniref:hypothetical protein n=1 Tax=Prosthecobacter sp. TaxID=1965333 RepID=UPI00378310BB